MLDSGFADTKTPTENHAGGPADHLVTNDERSHGIAASPKRSRFIGLCWPDAEMDGIEGERRALHDSFDLIMLDLMLPGGTVRTVGYRLGDAR